MKEIALKPLYVAMHIQFTPSTRWLRYLFECFFCIVTVISSLAAQNFNSARSFTLPRHEIAIATGDLNNDGIPDMVVGGLPDPNENHGRVRVLLGRGNGNFRLHGEYRVGQFSGATPARVVWDIGIGDLNNDGKNDVVVGHTSGLDQFNQSPLLTTVLFGNGDGTLQERESNHFFTDQDFVYALELVDFNNDGLLDVLIGTTGSSNRGGLFGLRNLGNGSFQRLGPARFSFPLYDMECGDINLDGNVDVVFATQEGIIVRYGDGAFFPSGVRIGDSNPIYQVVVDDLNSDGRVDIASLDLAGTKIKVYARRSVHFPLVPQTYTLPIGAGSELKAVDIDQNGTTDLVTYSGSPSQFFVYYGDGRGRFPTIGSIGYDVPISDIVFDDLDGNGRIDIAASLLFEESGGAAVFLNAPNPSRYYSDFDGDLRSDFTLFRPSEGMWYTMFSKDSSQRYQPFGLPTDRIVPGNYDGDKKADIAVFRDGTWFILHTADGSVRIEHFGASDDIPVPADYNNDGHTDLAIYRPSEGRWYIKDGEGLRTIDWGLKDDLPVAADYDGDGLADVAVWRPSTGVWYIQRSSDGQTIEIEFGRGQFGDIPVPADYDGDGKTDVAVWRPSEGRWYIRKSAGGLIVYNWGLVEDIPVQGDFDGDGKSDIAVWRPSEGIWFIHRSSDGLIDYTSWGSAADIPSTGR